MPMNQQFGLRITKIKDARSSWIRLASLWGLILGLTSACGGSSLPESPPRANQPTSISCRLVQHDFGETEICGDPENIAVIGLGALDSVLALGIKPIASTNVEFDIPYMDSEVMDGMVDIGHMYQPNLETIARVQPDLILACHVGNDEQIYKNLSQIAPTVYQFYCGDVWKETFQVFAAALNKSDEGQDLLDQYYSRIEEFQSRMGNRLEQTTLSVVVFLSDHFRIYLRDSFTGSVLEDVELPPPPAQQGREGYWEAISLEQVSIVDADVIFTIQPRPEETNIEQIISHPLWSRLKAVQQDNFFEVSVTWTAGQSIQGANYILDDLFRYLLDENEPNLDSN